MQQVQAIERLYAASTGEDVPFADIAGDLARQSDASLADAIQTDGLVRLERSLDVPLDRYLEAVPQLDAMPEALDAAVCVCLAALSRRLGDDSEAAVRELQRRYPRLRRAIREAALLDEVMHETAHIRRAVQGPPARMLPSDFGPLVTTVDSVVRPRYQLTRSLGSGSIGEVFAATDRMMSETSRPAVVAVKVLWSPSGGGRVEARHEALAVRRIEHAHVVRILDRGVAPSGEAYLVYDYIPGGNLADLLDSQGGRLEAREAVRIVRKVAEGVQAAHCVGSIHRDLKPANILLTVEGEPMVTDFGNASQATRGPASAGAAQGNIAFISPEQYRGELSGDWPQSDVYALGGLLFYLLTGEYPNGSTPAEVARIHDARAGRTTPPILPDLPGIDRDLRAICRRALEPDISRRYGSAGELAQDLTAWQHNFPLAWTRSPWFWHLRLAVRRHPTAAVCLLGGVLVLLISTWLIAQ
ncbi:MAG: serine/threonine protein kinase [Planctomycetaceae bacterium]|jgi:hypothetical protein|nr:serine/threonine protein kinase [Phycisphaerales bacterium]MCE2652171.1 serine/threonine protein kinase [Planctomycetaceae bacterium]